MCASCIHAIHAKRDRNAAHRIIDTLLWLFMLKLMHKHHWIYYKTKNCFTNFTVIGIYIYYIIHILPNSRMCQAVYINNHACMLLFAFE